MRTLATLLLGAALLALPVGVGALSPVSTSIDCPLPSIGLDGSVIFPEDTPAECLAVTTTVAPVGMSSGGVFFEAAFDGIVTGDDLGRAAFDVAGSVSYRDGILAASVGCNTISGPFEWSAGDEPGLRPLGPLALTRMFCDGLMEAETALLRVLEGADLHLVPDGITSGSGLLRVPGGVIVAMAASSGPVSPALPERPMPITLPDGARAIRAITLTGGTSTPIERGWLRLVDEEFSASVGCNTISGAATLNADGWLELDALMRTEMFCVDLDAQESALVAVLAGGDLRLADDRLSSSAGVIIFERADALPTSAVTTGSLGGSLAWLLLLLPLGAAAAAIAIGLLGQHEERQR